MKKRRHTNKIIEQKKNASRNGTERNGTAEAVESPAANRSAAVIEMRGIKDDLANILVGDN